MLAATTVERALSFPLDHVVNRYIRDHGVPVDVAQEHARELKRFLAVCALHPSNVYGMRGPVDDIWHTFLLFTKEYASFCDVVAGRFIHHVPHVGGENKADTREAYDRFLSAYEILFQESAPAHLWPRLPAAAADGANCNGCNGCQGCSPCET